MSSYEDAVKKAEAEADRLAGARWDIDGFNMARVMVVEEAIPGRPTSTIAHGGDWSAQEAYASCLAMAMARRIRAEHNALADLLKASKKVLGKARFGEVLWQHEIQELTIAISAAEAARRERK